MIKTETLENGFVRTYSDAGFYIHGGFPEADYAEAVDRADLNRTYTETNIPIEDSEMSDDAEYAEAGKIMMGVEE